MSGELTLVTDAGEQRCARAWSRASRPARRTATTWSTAADQPATYLEIGTRIAEDEAVYSDIDMELRRRARGRPRLRAQERRALLSGTRGVSGAKGAVPENLPGSQAAGQGIPA